ncbi:NADH-quinone oxidoreductase subunit K [Pseudodesulfovibrio hydrargyri]|uniref:NADH-quinone oxidoreductase subunit K n=1 Tax=Pseudodesulfovibrio hydrargyri TaxID=2125990 RepID=A0A1J5NBM3_9BACT|nr:NADH-quinone oxidoreductase subunit NuoK [Pseudodesulfovibrio hydrargyri]OIQ49129.1 NADH-quinone oxidoreductase subunit K [Pseudodesulfovibrio hydrargyri]
MIVPLEHVLLFAAALFFIGLITVVARRNLIMILLGVEVMLNAAGVVFVAAALRWWDIAGQGMVLFIMGVAAAEIAVGLTLVFRVWRRTRSLNPDSLKTLED